MRWFFIIAVIAALAAGGWFFFLRAGGPGAVEVVYPVRGQAVQAVYATGTVEPTVMLPIAARTSARLVEMNADEGSDVTKGQVLGRLEDENLQKSLEELHPKAVFARKNFDRKAELAKKGYETKAALDQARADWEAAKAAAARAEAEASYMKLVAPDDGRIIKRDGEIGQVIPANQPVFWLSCCAPLRISAEVDEEDISLVKPGQSVVIRADAFPGKIFNGKVQSITPKGDPVARSYRVRIGFSEETPLQIGMTTETNIVVRTQDNALLLPTSTLQKNKVLLVKDGRLTEQPVKTGARGPEQTEILSGVTEQDQVVLKPKEDMAAGQRVRATVVPQAP